jgi:hypothetical protein
MLLGSSIDARVELLRISSDMIRFRPLLALVFSCSCLAASASAASDKRPVPDYDGRGGPPTTPGDVLLWGPRILLLPPYFVSEYILRRPLGYVIAGAERSGLPAILYDFFTFGPDRNAGVFPTAYIDFGFSPSVGLYAFWNDAFFEGHDLRLRGATWGKNWLSASFAERFHLDEKRGDLFAIEASGLRRPDYMFFGIGPESRDSSQVRYGQDTLRLAGVLDQRLWRSSSLHAEVGVHSVDFQPGGFGDDKLLATAIADGSLPEPPGHRRGYTLVRTSAAVAIDSRLPRPEPGSGWRVAAGAVHGADLRANGSFIRYGGTLTGFLDLNDRHRVLSLSVGARFADPVGSNSEVPFTELTTLGGAEPMRGFVPGRLLGRSNVVADLAYRWPIWIWLDGSMHAEVGNVFDAHLSDFEPKLLRWSASLGVESAGTPDTGIQLLVGVGSETFDSGGKVNSFRLVLGTTHDF